MVERGVRGNEQVAGVVAVVWKDGDTKARGHLSGIRQKVPALVGKQLS